MNAPGIGPKRLLSATLSQLFALDAGAARRLAGLEGRVVALVVREREWRMTAAIRGGRIELVDAEAHAADVSISGRPADFVALVRASQRGESLAAGRIEITGDLAVAQEVQALIRELDVDFEELLARRFGDVAAHRIGRVLRGAGSASARGAAQLESDLLEYLRHELDVLPTRGEVDALFADIRAVSDAVERAEARLRRLAERRRRR